MGTKPVKKAKATNVKAELTEEEPEEEYQLNYIKNYYGEVNYHIYSGGYLVEMSGSPKPPPPYGGG